MNEEVPYKKHSWDTSINYCEGCGERLNMTGERTIENHWNGDVQAHEFLDCLKVLKNEVEDLKRGQENLSRQDED